MPGDDNSGPGGNAHDAETIVGAPAEHSVKIHPRCVRGQQHLESTLDGICDGPYTIEIRNNMYIIKTAERLDQKEVVRALLTEHEEIKTDNRQVEKLLGFGNQNSHEGDESKAPDVSRLSRRAGEGALEQISG